MRLLGQRLRCFHWRVTARLHSDFHSQRLRSNAPHFFAVRQSDPAKTRNPDSLRRHLMTRDLPNRDRKGVGPSSFAPLPIRDRKGAAMHKRGQATIEYAIVAAGVLIPMTFGIIYAAQLLWIWHSVTDFTREGARYATTHCWQSDGGNVLNYMKTQVPPMVDQQQLQSGPVEIDVSYFSRDPASGALTPFSCDLDCGTSCIPDTVTVQVRNYEFRSFVGYLGLRPVPIPDFQISMPIESAGCDPDSGVCLP